MAKYVVIEFDNDEDADYEIEHFNTSDARIVGLYKKPTIFCEHTDARKPPKGWTRGKKYGWWICTECGKPSQQWSRALPSMMGVNLLHHKELNNDQSNSTV